MDFKALISKMLEEKKLDKVNKDALKGGFKDRSDKDIDNDGEVDDQDEYLHNRRKTITKAIKKESIELDEKVNEKAIKKAVDDGKSMDVIVGMFANKRTTNTDEIRKVVKDYMWNKRMKKESVELDEAMFTVDDIDGMAKEIKSGLKAPFINVSKSTLGGAERVSVFIKVSLDKQEDWKNNIYQNSRHATFRVGSDDGTLELSTKHYNLPKFRKAKFKNTKDVISKINKWIDSASSIKESVELDEANSGPEEAISIIANSIAMNPSVVKDALEAANLDPVAVVTALKGKKTIKAMQLGNLVMGHAFGGSISKKDLAPIEKAVDAAFKASPKKMKESVQLDEADGWIAMYNGKKLEITKNDAKDLYSAKMYAAKELKVPKSKMGLLAISPAYNESNKENDLFNSLKEIIKNKMSDK